MFERFFKNLVKRGAVPDAKRDEAPLLEILQSRIDRYRTEIPPPSEAVFRREVSQLRRTARIFLREEELYCRETGNRPMFMEVSIGMKSEERRTVLDTDEPVEIKLPDGGSLRVRGRIDRIDQVAGTEPNLFAIWDYKTGGTWKFTQEPRPFWAGRVVQHALYTMVMTNRLKALAGEFPGAKSRAVRLLLSERERRRRKDRIHAQAARSRRRGSGRDWPRSHRAARSWRRIKHDKDCNFCDYAGICGDVASVAQASDRKLKSPSNTISDTLRGAARRWQSERRGLSQGRGPAALHSRRTRPRAISSSASSTEMSWSKRPPAPARRPAWSRAWST